MKSYAIQLPSGDKFTIVTDTPADQVEEAILERFRVYPVSVVDLTAPTSSFYLK
jgi:hypothetical protein